MMAYLDDSLLWLLLKLGRENEPVPRNILAARDIAQMGIYHRMY
ncbi:hypothetical protein NDS46_15060 [Paenibacillus thiaminolyticus]|nr:hypothetical protein [Paenibacillus thiaminolyticus]WCF05714.1 hypothetical protein NDS46_15060 [Paenibacillus thiaminolyticus]